MADAEKQEKILSQKIFSMETLLFCVGLFSLGSGFYTGEPMQYFWGGMIICGAIVLHFVRKKDWQKHWEEQEELQRRYEARRRMAEETKDDDR